MTCEDIVLSQSEYEALLEEIHRLQARISELTALRDDLIYHICPALQAEYEEKIASVERELLAAEMYLRENQRILEILQAQMNQQKKPSYEEAQKKAREEFHEYEEDLKRKAKEAEDFKQQWEKESRWSEHDRKEKEEKQKQEEKKQQRKNAQDKADYSKNKSSRLDGEEEDTADSSSEDESSEENKDHNGSGNRSKHRRKHGSRTDQIGADEDDYYDEDDPEQEGAYDNGEEGDDTDSPVKRLKRLYRKIVKRLHPDVHPDSTPREKELFNMAQQAMKNGDLEAMERIYDELSGKDAPEEKFEDTPEGIASLKELIIKLRDRLKKLQNEITHIKSVFPYTMKSFLEDEQAVEERRHELQEKLRNLREANEKLVDYISKLKKQMGI